MGVQQLTIKMDAHGCSTIKMDDQERSTVKEQDG